jgi:hypothetical protein
MAWEDFFNHKCDIYHIVKSDNDIGFGVTDSESFSYPSVPDCDDVDCHFMIRTGKAIVVQSEPTNDYDARIKLALPAGTDIRINDKVVSKETGLSYIAELPRTIKHNHHIVVYIKREGTVKEAI